MARADDRVILAALGRVLRLRPTHSWHGVPSEEGRVACQAGRTLSILEWATFLRELGPTVPLARVAETLEAAAGRPATKHEPLRAGDESP